MSDEGRHHAIPSVLNRELTIFGVPRVLLFASGAIGAGVFLFVWSVIAALLVFLLLCLLSYYLTAEDPAYPAILWSGIRMTAFYDPLVRKESVVEFEE